MSLALSYGRAATAGRPLNTVIDSIKKSAGTLATRISGVAGSFTKVKAPTQQVNRETRALKTGWDQGSQSAGRFGKSLGGIGKETPKAERGMTKLDGASKKVNKTWRNNALGMLMELFAPLIEKVVTMASKSKALQRVMKTAMGVISKVVGSAMHIVGPLVAGTSKAILGSFGLLKAMLLPVVYFFSGDIPSAFRAVKEGMSKAWDALPEKAKAVFRLIYEVVKGPINQTIGMVNTAIDGINFMGSLVKIPKWIPGIGGRDLNFHISHIPQLAEGGIVPPRSGGVPAIVAEAGQAEVVMPLSRLDQVLSRAAMGARVGTATGGSAYRSDGALVIENYYSTSAIDPQQTAKALMFLAKARG
ncbi:hypothetical protein [Streptomyces luteireticuli]|uniref:Phage tail protein n=1 Tax=Streptomyces luteireticuli TaxID=173858 RepID=A0ABP3IWF9_9ACTN